jgi:hypothetical protein
MTAASLAGHALAARQISAAGQANVQFSVMIWTLKKLGTFEENLERVAQAGYSHVELVGEFKQWSEDDYRRILARMQALKPWIRGSSWGRRFSRCAQGSNPGGQAAGMQADHSAFR